MEQQISKLLSPSKAPEETSLPLQIIDSISRNKPLQNFKVEPLVEKSTDLEEANQQLDIISEMSPSFSTRSVEEEDFQMFDRNIVFLIFSVSCFAAALTQEHSSMVL